MGSDVKHISDLVPDPINPRRHSPRNIGEIEDSLRAVGAHRSIVIDENNTVLAGNGMVEAAAQAGIERVQVVEADGNTIIAVRRTGLTERQKAELRIRDNRSGESADWNVDVLEGLRDEHELDLNKLGFYETELDGLRRAFARDVAANAAAAEPSAAGLFGGQAVGGSFGTGGSGGGVSGAGGTTPRGGQRGDIVVIGYCKDYDQQLQALNALRAVGIEAVAK